MVTVLSVVGARPNFMKLAPVARALDRVGVEHTVVHTGQHYDAEMSASFFGELEIPQPQYNLGVGSGSHATQTGLIMQRIEPVLLETAPDLLLVYGDVNSTLAASLVAAKLGIDVGHVEAGLRSHDWSMPEEVNRVLTDRLSQLLFAPSPDGVEHLRTEGIMESRIHLVGNVMIDTLVAAQPRAAQTTVLEDHGLEPQAYVVVTLHRPSNVDDVDQLRSMLQALIEISEWSPIIFPVHPRTRARLDEAALPLNGARIKLVSPMSYLDMLNVVQNAGLVITDSGGLQEETTYLGIPCLTVRTTTERPITCTAGTNVLVRPSGRDLLKATRDVREGRHPVGGPIEGWDGKASDRIAAIVRDHCR